MVACRQIKIPDCKRSNSCVGTTDQNKQFSSKVYPIRIVAAENFYGNLAEEIGGPYVKVTSILYSPTQDPHAFSSNLSTAKLLAKANILIYNGINYDPWMEKWVAINSNKNKVVINVAELLQKKPGENPHLWYDPKTMPAYADQLTKLLVQLDSVHKDYYQKHLITFKIKYRLLSQRITDLRENYRDMPVIATEPLFNYMAAAIGLKMYGDSFQLSVMNETNPSFSAVKDFENRLNKHQVKALIYNNQVTSPLIEHMREIAETAGIPVVGISEMQPMHQDYVMWMMSELNALAIALHH